MKLNRLLEITTILLNKKTVTASYLAERFDVSTRTIYRDVDVLSSSGVPVYCMQGANGGISILENYTLNRAALSDDEKNSMIFALQTLQATRYPDADSVLQKISGIFKNAAPDWISIDFTPWGSNPNSFDKFNDIRLAILQSRVIEVVYVNAGGEKRKREIEPLKLIYKSRAWYLWGYCRFRREYRTFRISRVRSVRVSDETFDRNAVHDMPDHISFCDEKPWIDVTLEFTEDVLYRLLDDYDDDMIIRGEDGKYTLDLLYPEEEWVYSYIMSFGASVRVVRPERFADAIKERAEKILKLYS